MIITKIEQYKNGRYKIYIDELYEFVLYSGELKKYHIEEGEELNSDTYREITEKVLVKRVRLRAMNLLMKHSFTEYQLRNKLRNSDYSESLVDNAIDYVISFGYINDFNFCMDYISSHRTDKSVNRMINDLIAKGVEKNTITNALAYVSDLDGPIDEQAMINKLLLKKHFDLSNATYEERMKMQAFLHRKGFSSDSIRRAVSCDFYD